MRIAAAPLLLALALAGCATAKPPAWVPAEGTYTADRAGFQIDGPAGWMRRNYQPPVETFLATRDGTALQRIVAGTTELGKPLGFGKSKRPVTAGMSPAELGELVVDDLQSADDLTDVRLLESAPAQVCGRPGFHVLAAFRDAGLPRRATLYGATDGGRLFWIYYVAPERHYYPLDLPTFDKVRETFRLRGAPPPAPAPAAPPTS
ncbi:MAG TPA: hypothetical protein VML50_16915 [Anaeromyxobacter sp.]|nr:hypothetical protein [Anaeromyxobacter sp.]